MLIQKHIPQLQIPMHDAAVVHILHGRDDLREKVPGFGFREAFPTFQEVHHVLGIEVLAMKEEGRHGNLRRIRRDRVGCRPDLHLRMLPGTERRVDVPSACES